MFADTENVLPFFEGDNRKVVCSCMSATSKKGKRKKKKASLKPSNTYCRVHYIIQLHLPLFGKAKLIFTLATHYPSVATAPQQKNEASRRLKIPLCNKGYTQAFAQIPKIPFCLRLRKI